MKFKIAFANTFDKILKIIDVTEWTYKSIGSFQTINSSKKQRERFPSVTQNR